MKSKNSSFNHEIEKKSISFFEFWPTWLMYIPVAIQWFWLSIWYRSLTVPLLANPQLTLAGMVGVKKSELFLTAKGHCKEAILNWLAHTKTDEPALQQAEKLLEEMNKLDIELPFVCKPDIGCRGAGVKLINNIKQFVSAINSYPVGSSLLCQKLATWEPEAGVFFVKMPELEQGEIVSLTLKYKPYVIGDGKSTLERLIEMEPRAGKVKHLYFKRNKALWKTVLPKGYKFQLVFSASHCLGAVFEDAREYITPELTHSINKMMSDLPDFYYGRLDIKFSNIENLKLGKDIEIVEINSASSEAIHIWDKNGTLADALKTLLWQYRTLFKLGDYQRSQGYKAPTVKKVIKHLLVQIKLTKRYPLTD